MARKNRNARIRTAERIHQRIVEKQRHAARFERKSAIKSARKVQG